MRLNNAEIDAQIIDTAAGLFAVHSYQRTSVQQIADAVGYSKTGLLHRFPSKQAMLDAVHQIIATAIARVSADVAALPADVDRTLRVLELVTDTALAHPGAVRYLLQAVHREHSAASMVIPAKEPATSIVDLLAGPDPSAEREMRAVLGLELICSGAVLSVIPEHSGMGPALRPLLVELAHGVIGDPPDSPNPPDSGGPPDSRTPLTH